MSLEQYYTEEKIGERLVSLLPELSPEHCIELSAGEGALLIPVINKWPTVEIATCELDPTNHSKLIHKFPGQHHIVDVMSEDFEDVYLSFSNKFDLAICNPPFTWKKSSKYEKSLLETFGLSYMKNWKRVRSEIIFILQNLRLLDIHGLMAIILPDLIVRSKSFSEFRKILLNYCSICSVCEIEKGAFKGTEAKTYILVVKKGHGTARFSFFRAQKNELKLSQGDFVQLNLKSNPTSLEVNIKSLFSIKRGCHSGKDLRSSKIPYYHTTGFSATNKANKKNDLNEFSVKEKKPIIACKGDVLIHRVGSRSLGKASVVENGSVVISDCVFRVRAPDFVCPYQLKDYWQEIRPIILSSARGTCAKYITKEDVYAYLEEFYTNIVEQSLTKNLVTL